ncbi:Transposase [Sulfobacillus thermosulfidooxidans DSM 9293]|uniref:Transposase n=1 Tax=Sulfobacillus thermosulfidooxidans (strain DSM 9293 / VKM B-1269 / AT-1) TaxID=929705 RepID=A0A1W1W8W2_SULTA|nr:helix-turn-helix domain-containing protein [Sulfobacillus thermosulfidooxidans]SMC02183.1 Transposase [Sulfobacillus thermosulfidooxidans DSM 9293]
MCTKSHTDSPEFKQQIVQEAQDTQNAPWVARRHQLSPSMVRRWVHEAVKSAHHPHRFNLQYLDNSPARMTFHMFHAAIATPPGLSARQPLHHLRTRDPLRHPDHHPVRRHGREEIAVEKLI